MAFLRDDDIHGHSFLPEMDQLSALPSELLVTVLRNLGTVDISTVRLLNKRLQVAATPFLLDSVVLSPHQTRIDRFKAICQHKVISQFIRTVRYDTTYFLPWYREHPYHAKIRRRASITKIFSGKQQYLCLEQKSLEPKMEAILLWGLQLLPKVTTMVPSDECRSSSCGIALPDARYVFYSQEEKNIIQKYLKANQSGLYIGFPDTEFPSSCDGRSFTLLTLMRAISQSGAKIQVLKTSALDDASAQRTPYSKVQEDILGFVQQDAVRECFVDPPLLQPASLTENLTAFKHLKTLSLGIHRLPSDIGRERTCILPRLLCCGESLEDLTLGFNTASSYLMRDYDDLEDWFGVSGSEPGPACWFPKQLKRIHLFNVITTYGSLSQLFSIMEGTVQEVELKHVVPRDKDVIQDWEKLFDALRALKLRKMYAAFIPGFTRVKPDDVTLRLKALDYVMNRIDENPLVGMEIPEELLIHGAFPFSGGAR